MHKLARFVVPAIFLSAAAPLAAQNETGAQARGDEPAREYVRLHTNEYGTPLSLQTEVVSFAGPAPDGAGPLRVDLIGAVHLGDAGYYAALNERFVDYDSVLYEIVAPQGTRVPRGGGEPRGLLSGMQLALTRLLGLTFQLQQVDYTPENLVHADLSPEELERSMNERGESFVQYFFRLFAASMSEEAQESAQGQGAGLLYALLFAEDRERMLKIQLAEALTDMDMLTSVLDGEEGSTLITERNKRAIDILHEQIALGDRNIGIFYGAGHMDDFAERLEAELGLEAVEHEWLDAWDLR